MPVPVRERVSKRRAQLRAAGLRPVQLWLPDVQAPGFAEECARQAQLTALADAQDDSLGDVMDAALTDLVNEPGR